MLLSVEQATGGDFWTIVERTSWVVGILVASLPAVIALANAWRGKSADTRRGGPGTNVVTGNSFGKKARIKQTNQVTTTNLFYQPVYIEQSSPNRDLGNDKKGDTPGSPWLLLTLIVAIVVASFFTYLNYRGWALGFTAGVVSVTILTTLLTSVLVRRVGDKGVNGGLWCNTLAVLLAGGLLWRLGARSSPYGDYSALREHTRGEGWVARLLTEKTDILMFVTLEILALAYILVVMVMIIKHQLGILTALNSARSGPVVTQGLTRWLVRSLAPRNRWQLLGIPILLSILIGLAWLFSSVWFFRLVQEGIASSV